MKNIFYLFAMMLLFNCTVTAQLETDTIQVISGWNLIGSVTTGPVIDIISTEPPGIIEGTIYGYNPEVGYYGADTLDRSEGYWVKVSQNGVIIIGFNTPFVCGTSQIYYYSKAYNTVQIGSQCWFKENLDVGNMIQGNQNSSNNGVIEKYCYGNDISNCRPYGGLYQWDEAMQYVTTQGVQGICPPGWHIPTLTELQTLSSTVGGDGNALKAVGQGSGGGTGTNTSGFSALLAGYLDDNGDFTNLGSYSYSWTSTELSSTYSYRMLLNDYDSNIYSTYASKTFGFSVRCLKD